MSKNTPQDNAPEATSAEGSSCGCDCGCTENAKCCALCPGEKTLAFWILRLWLGARALLTGLSKFETVEEVAPASDTAVAGAATTYGLSNASAAAVVSEPAATAAVSAASTAVANTPAATETAAQVTTHLSHHGLPTGGAWTLESFSNLSDWPRLGWLVMPKWALHLLDGTLGYILILLGVTLLLGIGTRISLFLQGVLYVALTAGFIIITQEPGSSSGITMLGVHIALVVAALLLVKHNKLVVLKKY